MISKEFKNRVLTSIFLIFTLYFIIKFNLFLVFCLIIFGVLSILEFIKILNLIIKSKFILISLNIFFILYIFLFCLIFFYFSSIQHLKVMLFILLLTCIASDIGGYVIGKILKGPKITKISPKKTFSGIKKCIAVPSESADAHQIWHKVGSVLFDEFLPGA